MSGTLDLSTEDGRPVMLYEFTRRSVPTISGVPVVVTWYYTSADRDYDFDGNTYLALSLEDDGIRQTGDPTNDDVTISLPASAAVPQLFAVSAPSDLISVIIRQTHRDQTDAFISWVGQISAVTRGRDAVTAQVNCIPANATLDRAGLRLCWTRSCPHDLYGFRCRAPANANYIPGTVTSVNPSQVAAAAWAGLDPAATGFMGGFIEWITPEGFAERRGIIMHYVDVPTTLKVMGVIHGVLVGDTVWAFRGCNRTTDNCTAFFGNLPNYGGHEYLPGKNVFTGETIF